MQAKLAGRDAAVARNYEEFLSTLLSHKAAKRLVFWGISDIDNWVVRGETGERRKKGASRPALFDADNEPKPAFDAVVRVLKAAPSRA